MSKIAMFKYKCRNCDVIYSDSGIKYDLAYGKLLNILNGTDGDTDDLTSQIKMFDIHECKIIGLPDNIGVADLIGYRVITE